MLISGRSLLSFADDIHCPSNSSADSLSPTLPSESIFFAFETKRCISWEAEKRFRKGWLAFTKLRSVKKEGNIPWKYEVISISTLNSVLRSSLRSCPEMNSRQQRNLFNDLNSICSDTYNRKC